MKTKTKRALNPIFILMWSFIVLIGCNLGTSGGTQPPTLMPRASATPPPTLGYSDNGTTSNGEIAVSNITTPVGSVDDELFNLMEQVDAGRMMNHVEALQNFHTRHVNSSQSSETEGIGAARRYIETQFRLISQSSGGRLNVIPQEFSLTYNGIGTKQYNVLAAIQGTEPGASTLIIGAHYDSVGGGSLTDAGVYAPGANDNGSGIAALIELGRILSQKQYRSTIILVAFSAEEVNRVGSREFVKFLQQNNVDIVGMINIDAIGNANDRQGQINDRELRTFSRGPNESSNSRQMARTAELLSFVHNAPLRLRVEDAEDRENRYGDHSSFSEVGYPAIRFINPLEEKANADSADTIEFIEPDYMRRATQSILLVTIALADGPLPPSNITLRDSGENGNTLRWEPVPGAVGYLIALRPPGSLTYDYNLEWNDTTITWDGFGNYAGIAIAARGPDGLIGRLSGEYQVGR